MSFAYSKDVMVKTKDGPKEIKQITAGDLVYVTDAFIDCWASTNGYVSLGPADVFKVTFSNGKILYTTVNHNFGVIGGYGEIFSLRPLYMFSENELEDGICCDNGDIITICSIDYFDNLDVGNLVMVNDGLFCLQNGIICGGIS